MRSTNVVGFDEAADALLDSLSWRLIGPHRGGRVTAVAGHPSDRNTFYSGACAGGVWKTIDSGQTWECISDGFLTTAAIGALVVSPSDPNVIYAATGEGALRGNISHGDGIYKSTDGGRTWANTGLADTRHINDMVIHPDDPNVVYVAAVGHAWGPNEERGVFRTLDGGATWTKVLFKNDTTGAGHIALDPTNPRIVYASLWNGRRGPHFLSSGGPDCGLYRSTDGGSTWAEISRNPGFQQGLIGKIGVTASPAQPGRVWALVEAVDGALYRSDDYGDTWERVSDDGDIRRRPYYYFDIYADPQDPETLWILNVKCWKSIDGGKNFLRIPTPHNDHHALWIDPHDPDRMVLGHDGGVCVSHTGGTSWSTLMNQPTAQLYHVTTDNRFPYRVYGSQQDNTAISVPSASSLGAISSAEWNEPGGGESGYIAVRPDDQVVVASAIGSGFGNGRLTRYDYRAGQIRNITVWPEVNSTGAGGSGAEDLKYRFQWTFPIAFSPHDPRRLYVAANHLFTSVDEGSSWDIISPDLTRNDPSKLKASGGPITRCNSGVEVYCTIFAFVESPHEPGVFWAGTDDGLVHLSRDGGATWENVTPPDLPEWTLISIIEVSAHDPATAYLAATRYKLDDTRPYLYKTEDYGKTWTQIVDGIASDDFTRVIREDPGQPGLLFAGTETGIYVSFNAGTSWLRMQGTFPVVPVYDFVIKGNDLVVATHGRSFWILDDLSPLRQLAADGDVTATRLFTPPTTVRMKVYGGRTNTPVSTQTDYRMAGPTLISYQIERDTHGLLRERLFDAGENPAAGMSVWYWIGDTTDAVELTIRDERGERVRAFSSQLDPVPDSNPDTSHRLSAPGWHRIQWDLRHSGPTPLLEERMSQKRTQWDGIPGPIVVPGVYSIELKVGEQRHVSDVTVIKDPRITTSDQELQEQLDLLLMIRDTLSDVYAGIGTLRALRGQVTSWADRIQRDDLNHPLLDELTQVANLLSGIEGELIQLDMESPLQYPTRLREKLIALIEAVDSADAAPTRQAREVGDDLRRRVDAQLQRLQHVASVDIALLNQRLKESLVPAIA